jgi:histidine phosphotransferase ChpT
MTAALALDSLDLAALVCSRVCHDLISPVGAIVNGLEVLEDDHDESTRTVAFELIKKSAHQASSRLQFCRLAFGAAGSKGAQLDLGEAEAVTRGFFADNRIAIDWRLPQLLLPKNRVKLLLNLVLVAGQVIPRGGRVTVEAVGDGEAMGFRVTATGEGARIPPALPGLLAGEPSGVDAHAIQPFFTGMLARTCGLAVSVAVTGDAVVLAAIAAAA